MLFYEALLEFRDVAGLLGEAGEAGGTTARLGVTSFVCRPGRQAAAGRGRPAFLRAIRFRPSMGRGAEASAEASAEADTCFVQPRILGRECKLRSGTRTKSLPNLFQSFLFSLEFVMMANFKFSKKVLTGAFSLFKTLRGL